MPCLTRTNHLWLNTFQYQNHGFVVAEGKTTIYTFLGFQAGPTRCDQCAKFSARIGSCSDAERPNVEMAQKIHIDGVKAFRCLQDRLQMLSIESTTTTESAPTQSVLKIDIDGLDQAKTRWPRNLSSAKALSQLWRPNIHIVGFIAHGAP